jgi:3-hydroxyisobutyrate dehydrogenase
MTIGFVGLGVFGGRIATRLVHEGFGLMIHDRVTDAVRYFMLKNSADVAEAPRTLAALCDVVVCVLPTPDDVREIALGPLGLAEGRPEGKTVPLVDLGTSSSAQAQALAAELAPHGIAYVEAPAYGVPLDARDGRLVIPFGCDDPAITDRVMPVLRALSGQVRRTGAPGSAHVMAALTEQMRAAAMLAAAEALALGAAAGVAPEAFVESCESAGLIPPTVANTLRRHAFARTAAGSGHTFSTLTHNLALMQALAAEKGFFFEQGKVLARVWSEAAAARGPEADHADIVRFVAEAARPAPGDDPPA